MIDVGTRTWQPGLLFVALVMVTACTGSDPSGLIEIHTPMGFLDCPSDLYQIGSSEIATESIGSGTPEAALALLTADLGLPPGTPQIESQTAEEVVFLFADPEGHRLGRVGIVHFVNGWFVGTTASCG